MRFGSSVSNCCAANSSDHGPLARSSTLVPNDPA